MVGHLGARPLPTFSLRFAVAPKQVVSEWGQQLPDVEDAGDSLSFCVCHVTHVVATGTRVPGADRVTPRGEVFSPF